MTKPKLLITRKLRPDVEARAACDYDVTFNSEDRLFTREELIAACRAVPLFVPVP